MLCKYLEFNGLTFSETQNKQQQRKGKQSLETGSGWVTEPGAGWPTSPRDPLVSALHNAGITDANMAMPGFYVSSGNSNQILRLMQQGFLPTEPYLQPCQVPLPPPLSPPSPYNLEMCMEKQSEKDAQFFCWQGSMIRSSREWGYRLHAGRMEKGRLQGT